VVSGVAGDLEVSHGLGVAGGLGGFAGGLKGSRMPLWGWRTALGVVGDYWGYEEPVSHLYR
jgi:hypothetical protein